MILQPLFEPREYEAIPHLPVAELVELIRALVAGKPDDGPMDLDEAADELERLADKAERALAARGDEHDSELERVEVEFESWTDTLAGMIRSQISAWERDADPALLELLSDDPKERLELPELRERAARAKVVCGSLFADDGRDFFRLSYERRFSTLAAILSELRSSSPLAVFSQAYEAQVEAHLRIRTPNSARSLAKHRVALRWAIAMYCGEIGDGVDRRSKASCDRANTALSPLIDACNDVRGRRQAKADSP